MAVGPRADFQDKLSDLIECSICSEIFKNPKILPCLHCLENYGKDKKPGDRLVCPLCRNEFFIPDDGFYHLPNNFFIGKMIEIGKLVMTPSTKAMCALCPEEEEVFAVQFCKDCQHSLCDRCSKSHKKTKLCQNHQIVDLGNQLSPQELNSGNCYCDHHPGEQIKMYCYDDNVAICLICCIESHQSHRCANVNKASEEFRAQLKDDLRKVTDRFPECEEVLKRLTEYKNEFTEEVFKTEQNIRDTATKLKELHVVDQHAETLIKNLTLVTYKNTKAIENTRGDVERFRVMISSYNRYSEELLAKGSNIDICRAAFQMHLRANELNKLPANCSGYEFHCDTVALRPSNVEDLLKKYGSNNAIGLLLVTTSSDRLLVFQREVSVSFSCETDTIAFVMQRRELKIDIEEALKRNNCSIVWPEIDINEVKLLIYNRSHQKSLNDSKRESLEIVQNYMSDINCKTVKVDPHLWTEYRSVIQNYFTGLTHSKPLFDIAYDDEQFEIQYVGLKKNIVGFEKTLLTIWESLEKEIQQRKKISETLANLKPYQLALIRTPEFQKKLKQEFPSVHFEMKTAKVNLFGIPDDLKKAKLFLYEKVNSTLLSSFEISDIMIKVFTKDEAKFQLVDQLLSNGISASWMHDGRKVVVFASDGQHLKEAVNVLKNEVVQERFQLNRYAENLVQSNLWKQFVKRLRKKDKLLEVEVHQRVILLACMRCSIDQITEEIEDFIANQRI